MKIQKQILPLALLLTASTATYAQDMTITGITVTESRCEQNGTLTVAATGGTGNTINYRYEIIAPSCCTRPVQDAPEFASLLPNTYTVVAKDVVAGTADTSTATITGDYVIMDPTATVDNSSCTSDGASVSIAIANGRPPYSYEITSPVAEATGIGTGNTFTGLTYGTTYTYRVWDSCGNFQTRTVTPMAADNGTFAVAKNCLTKPTCDSFAMEYNINVAAPQVHRYPYVLEFFNPDGSIQMDTIFSGPSSGVITHSFNFEGDATGSFGLTVTNTCGTINSNESITSLSDYLEMFAVATPLCGDINQYRVDAYDNATASTCDQPNGSSVTYTLYDSSGTLIATQVNNSTFSGAGIIGGPNYKVVRSTTCGADSIIFNWSSTPPAINVESFDITRNTCKDNTANVRFLVRNAIGAVKVIMTNGPASVTFDDSSTYNYIYPDTINNYNNSQFINFLGTGTYDFTIMDICGNFVTRSINISSSFPRSSDAIFSQTDGCVNSNRINWNVSGNSTVNQGVVSISPGGYTQNITSLPANGNASSLPSGTYYCSYVYTPGTTSNRYLKNMASLGCDTIKDTISIESYENPIFYGPSVTKCSGSNSEILLIPDLTKGVAPFTYEIISGPVLRTAQSSPFFTNLPYGTYTFRMSDACGNSFTANKEIEELTAVTFETTGNTCENGEAMFAVPRSPYITYNWTKPDGSTFQGDTLIINPVTAADTGTYEIEMWVDVAGCRDTVYFAQRLADFCDTMVLPVSFANFYGKAENGKAMLYWQTTKEQNNTGFDIERSVDGKVWNKIGFTPTKANGGNSTSLLGYVFADVKPATGKNFYRLKQIDLDGKFDYSRTVSMIFGETGKVRIYPNPAQTLLTVEAAANSDLYLYNILGQQVSVPVTPNGTAYIMDMTKVASGNYTLQIVNGANVEVHKVTIAH